MLTVGLFGKLPSYGDFLQRDLPGEFVDAWDGWLQRVMVGSREALGEQWLPSYLSAPIWRFALAEDIAGGSVWSGILMPSVDRVGRYFPLAIAGQWRRGTSVFHLALAAEGWLHELEAIALEALDASYLDLDALMGRVHGLQRRQAPPRQWVDAAEWQGHFSRSPDLHSAWIDRLESQAGAELDPLSLWWTAGSEVAAAQWKARRAWPDATGFVQMLCAGRADQSGQPEQSGPVVSVPNATARHQVQAQAMPVPRSAGVSGAGHVRSSNQDAWIDRGDASCWAVADGMGGHEDGDRASRTVVDTLSSQLRVAGSLASLSTAVRSAIEAANQSLRRGVAEGEEYAAGSTVVALALCGSQAAALWVGDSRLYLWRQGRLVQVTDDHVAADSAAHEITRAVGGAASVAVDEKRFTLQPGDRLLLCSDGVHGVLQHESLVTLMGVEDDPLATVQAIERAVLAGRAPDNYTALAVFI